MISETTVINFTRLKLQQRDWSLVNSENAFDFPAHKLTDTFNHDQGNNYKID